LFFHLLLQKTVVIFRKLFVKILYFIITAGYLMGYHGINTDIKIVIVYLKQK